MIEVVYATQEHIDALKGRLRPADEAECMSLGYTGSQALQESFDASTICVVGMHRKVPVYAGGVSPLGSLLGNDGVAWCLTTPEVFNLARSFMRTTRAVIHKMFLPRYKNLYNVVDARYNAALKWLCWLGFTIEAAQPLGVGGEMFHPISLRS